MAPTVSKIALTAAAYTFCELDAVLIRKHNQQQSALGITNPQYAQQYTDYRAELQGMNHEDLMAECHHLIGSFQLGEDYASEARRNALNHMLKEKIEMLDDQAQPLKEKDEDFITSREQELLDDIVSRAVNYAKCRTEVGTGKWDVYARNKGTSILGGAAGVLTVGNVGHAVLNLRSAKNAAQAEAAGLKTELASTEVKLSEETQAKVDALGEVERLKTSLGAKETKLAVEIKARESEQKKFSDVTKRLIGITDEHTGEEGLRHKADTLSREDAKFIASQAQQLDLGGTQGERLVARALPVFEKAEAELKSAQKKKSQAEQALRDHQKKKKSKDWKKEGVRLKDLKEVASTTVTTWMKALANAKAKLDAAEKLKKKQAKKQT